MCLLEDLHPHSKVEPGSQFARPVKMTQKQRSRVYCEGLSCIHLQSGKSKRNQERPGLKETGMLEMGTLKRKARTRGTERETQTGRVARKS